MLGVPCSSLVRCLRTIDCKKFRHGRKSYHTYSTMQHLVLAMYGDEEVCRLTSSFTTCRPPTIRVPVTCIIPHRIDSNCAVFSQNSHVSTADIVYAIQLILTVQPGSTTSTSASQCAIWRPAEPTPKAHAATSPHACTGKDECTSPVRDSASHRRSHNVS